MKLKIKTLSNGNFLAIPGVPVSPAVLKLERLWESHLPHLTDGAWGPGKLRGLPWSQRKTEKQSKNKGLPASSVHLLPTYHTKGSLLPRTSPWPTILERLFSASPHYSLVVQLHNYLFKKNRKKTSLPFQSNLATLYFLKDITPCNCYGFLPSTLFPRQG